MGDQSKSSNNSKPISKIDKLIERILIDYRWIFVCFFLLPMSLVYDIYFYFRAWLIFRLNSAPKNHAGKVLAVQKQVREWNLNGRKTQMCTARPGWQTISFRQPRYKDTLCKVNVNLVDILNLDVEKKVITVEPMVTMGQLTACLEPLGWTIPVLPELDDLTVGGLVMGTGIETSSHKFGLFQHICESYELVLASGELVRCSKDKDSDLYYAVPWSYGTLGFLTAVEIRIIPATRFIKLDYYPVTTLDDAVKLLSEYAEKDDGNQFVEGLMFGRDQAVIMIGNMVNSAEPNKINEIGKWYKPWFFKHVERFLHRRESGSEYIPLRDYFHRHTRSIFWEIREIIPFGNNIIFRFLLGWMTPPKVSLLKLTQPQTVKRLYEENHMIQDMLVPISNLKESIITFDEETGIYPLWICPFRLVNDEGMLHRPNGKDEMYVDIGAYGVPKRNTFHPSKTTREIERKVREVKGFQMLYADTYMTREEFRQMFDHTLYDKVRRKYDCLNAFPEVYDKVSKAARR